MWKETTKWMRRESLYTGLQYSLWKFKIGLQSNVGSEILGDEIECWFHHLYILGTSAVLVVLESQSGAMNAKFAVFE